MDARAAAEPDRAWPARQLRAATLAAGLALGGAAQAEPPSTDGSTVGRLAWLAGEVLLQPSAAAGGPARLNASVGSGDVVGTGASGRAELRFGASVLRLDTASVLRVTAVDAHRHRLRIDRGSAALRVDDAEQARQTVLETPLGQLLPQEAGEWRVDIGPAGISASAMRGGIRFEGGGSAVTVLGGQRAHLRAVGSAVQARFDAGPHDDFQAFVTARNRRAGDGRPAPGLATPP